MIAQLKRHCRFANSKHTFGGSLNPLGAGGGGGGERGQNMDFGAGSQTLLTRAQLFVKF